MPKITLEELGKTDKKRLKIWEKEKPIIEIGDALYEVGPQPARAVLEFKALVKLYVDYAGQFKDRPAKEIQVSDLEGLVETVVESPYYLLRPLVPDLKQEDADAAPWGQTFSNLRVLLEINGLGWGEALLKEHILPFLPRMLESLVTLGVGAARAKVSLGANGSAETSTSSLTSSAESPTISIPEESSTTLPGPSSASSSPEPSSTDESESEES